MSPPAQITAPERLLAEGSPALVLAREFRASGRALYLVGGSVRDISLERAVGDLDFSTDARPKETLAILRKVTTRVWEQGIDFGTVGAEVGGAHVEITTFRTERYEPASRHPDVSFVGDVVTDLSRRDFTVNAMALGLPGGELLDPFNGRRHLEERLLTTPIEAEESFTDDPLRMLRAFRFASQLDFRIDKRVVQAIANLRDLMATVSAERTRDELTKLLLGLAPGRALQIADATGIMGFVVPELSALKLQQDPVHRHKDVFSHTLAVIERTDPVPELRLAAMLHDIGKPKTRRIGPEGVSFHHHEVVGAKMAGERLRALRYPNEVVGTVTELIRMHHRFHTYRLGWNDSAVRRYVRDAGPLLGLLNDLVRADCTTRNPDKAARIQARMHDLEVRIAELAATEELGRIRPELDGHQVMSHLGVAPGPVVGRAMDFLLELRLEEGILGEAEAYRRLDAWWAGQGNHPGG